MDEDGATDPAAPSFPWLGEGTVVAHHHHPHISPLSPCPLQGHPEIQPVPGVVLHNQEDPSCRMDVETKGLMQHSGEEPQNFTPVCS